MIKFSQISFYTQIGFRNIFHFNYKSLKLLNYNKAQRIITVLHSV